ncbi:FecR domain-containing protein [Sorangium sp. So ce1036]|uniref:tetratricopeptide repeat protein n=1 Tax=Sorangium sp. So ce1036 TaxID=3133328 RepID=UPI003F03D8FE
MSRRGLPRIAPADLRDHATEERIARVWDRIEHDVQAREPQAPRRAGVAALLAAATLTAFAGGLWVGRAVFREPQAAPAPLAVAKADDMPSLVDVFAAGSHARTFPLPGGGKIVLRPGTTVEVEQANGGALTLRLVQGEASVDTASAVRTAALAIVAGEARLSTSAGSVLRVRHNVDDIDVDVTDGAVKLTSPAGSRELGRGDAAAEVPIRRRTTAVAPPEEAPRPRVAVAPSPPSSSSPPPPRSSAAQAHVESPAASPPAPDWRARYNAGDVAEALRSLKQQPGGVDGAIASARTAKELMDLSDLLRDKSGDHSTGDDRGAAMRALTRVVEGFPSDANAQIAAYTLGNMYASMGDQALAAKYYEQARTLSPEGNLAEDSFCKRIRAEVVAGRKEEASVMAREYVATYPDGRCEDVRQLVSGEEASEEEEAEAEPEPPSEPALDASPAP